jgi:alkanesulfonate monooxygenase SsuD/methylene tetrahydromethanopterin reductase-like flavin-dependent oxidoreductase (luciferase family)
MSIEFYLFLPQMRMSFAQIIERAQAAESAGFGGIAGMDHLAPPMAEHQPMYEAMITNTLLAANTTTLRVGSLVLCDMFRHPAMLARECVSLDHLSNGRFDLGIGWGSVPTEFEVFGAGSVEPKVRVERLAETLEIITALWAGETVDYQGTHFTMKGARQEPQPLGHIPIVIGGAGKKTLRLVSKYADWWNLHVGWLDRLEELRPQAGDARASLQIYVSHIPSEDRRDEITATTRRRFGQSPLIGTSTELVDRFGELADRGVERIYAWFCDFAQPDTLAAFGDEVINQLR